MRRSLWCDLYGVCWFVGEGRGGGGVGIGGLQTEETLIRVDLLSSKTISCELSMDFEERRRGWVQTDLTENSKTKTSFLKVRKTDMADATHICTELNTKILKNNYNPDIHVLPFDCGICFMETATVLDTPSSSLSVPIFYLTSRNFYHASQIFILHLACQIFYFACHIFISHFAFFISHLVLLSRISHVTFSI